MRSSPLPRRGLLQERAPQTGPWGSVAVATAGRPFGRRRPMRPASPASPSRPQGKPGVAGRVRGRGGRRPGGRGLESCPLAAGVRPAGTVGPAVPTGESGTPPGAEAGGTPPGAEAGGTPPGADAGGAAAGPRPGEPALKVELGGSTPELMTTGAPGAGAGAATEATAASARAATAAAPRSRTLIGRPPGQAPRVSRSTAQGGTMFRLRTARRRSGVRGRPARPGSIRRRGPPGRRGREYGCGRGPGGSGRRR